MGNDLGGMAYGTYYRLSPTPPPAWHEISHSDRYVWGQIADVIKREVLREVATSNDAESEDTLRPSEDILKTLAIRACERIRVEFVVLIIDPVDGYSIVAKQDKNEGRVVHLGWWYTKSFATWQQREDYARDLLHDTFEDHSVQIATSKFKLIW